MILDSLLAQQFFILYFEIRPGLENDNIPSGISRKFAFHEHILADKYSVRVLPFTSVHITLYLNARLDCCLVIHCENLRFKINHVQDNHILLQGSVLTVIHVSSERCVKLRDV